MHLAASQFLNVNALLLLQGKELMLIRLRTELSITDERHEELGSAYIMERTVPDAFAS